MTIPNDGLTRRQRAAAAAARYAAADLQTFNQLDDFYTTVGSGESVRPAQTVADYYGVPVEIFNTLWWRRRSSRILIKLADRADALGFWTLPPGRARDRMRQQIINEFLTDVSTGAE